MKCLSLPQTTCKSTFISCFWFIKQLLFLFSRNCWVKETIKGKDLKVLMIRSGWGCQRQVSFSDRWLCHRSPWLLCVQSGHVGSWVVQSQSWMNLRCRLSEEAAVFICLNERIVIFILLRQSDERSHSWWVHQWQEETTYSLSIKWPVSQKLYHTYIRLYTTLD